MNAPTGDVWLGHVPWNNNYRDVYLEGMNNKQLIINTFMTLHTTNYTYIREDTNIRVPYNADSLYGINYCMYQNDGMWFCAFVTTITYVSNNTALLHLEEDVWHTWGGSITWNACMVEREHVLSDNLGQWRAPEPAISLESFVTTAQDFNQIIYNMLVVGTNAIPHLKSGVSGTIFSAHSDTDFDGSDAVSGGFYNTIFSGAKYYAFGRGDVGAFTNFMDNLNKCGAAESICCMFMMSSAFIDVGSNYEVNGVLDVVSDGFNAPQYHGRGYVPRNKKCLTFPYAYATIVDHSGGTMDIKYEDCDTWGVVNYQIGQGMDATSQPILTMKNYMGRTIDQSHMMPLASNPQCSWVYSAYQNWAAQNAESLAVKKEINYTQVGIGALMTAVGTVLFASGAGAPIGGPLAAAGITTGELAGLGAIASGLKTGLGGYQAEEGRYAEIDAQSKVPNHTVGGSSGNSMQGIGRNQGGYYCMTLQDKSAARLDQFFDVFGYAIDEVKVPNYSGRARWNYVKTVGANMTGNIPADRLALINRCLDGGITFWHTVDVGDYGYSNPINGG